MDEFKIIYQIIASETDEFWGENGNFIIQCADFAYEYLHWEQRDCSEDICLKNCFEKMLRVLEMLRERDSVALKDMQTQHTSIVFDRKEEYVFIRLSDAARQSAIGAIETMIPKPEIIGTCKKPIPFISLEEAIYNASKEYIRLLIKNNSTTEDFVRLLELFQRVFGEWLSEQNSWTPEESLYYLLRKYFYDREYTTSIFCDEFIQIYGHEISDDSLTKEERFYFKKIFGIVSRFSPFEEEHQKYPKGYYKEQDVLKVVEEAIQKLGIVPSEENEL